MLQRKLPLGHVARVGFTKDSVPITRDNLTALQSRPHILADGFVRCVLADDILHLTKPNKNLLVGKTVKGTRKTIQSGTKRQEGV